MKVIATTCNIDQYNKWMHIRIITPGLHHSSECVGYLDLFGSMARDPFSYKYSLRFNHLNICEYIPMIVFAGSVSIWQQQ
jgi:hypothetical protein